MGNILPTLLGIWIGAWIFVFLMTFWRPLLLMLILVIFGPFLCIFELFYKKHCQINDIKWENQMAFMDPFFDWLRDT